MCEEESLNTTSLTDAYRKGTTTYWILRQEITPQVQELKEERSNAQARGNGKDAKNAQVPRRGCEHHSTRSSSKPARRPRAKPRCSPPRVDLGLQAAWLPPPPRASPAATVLAARSTSAGPSLRPAGAGERPPWAGVPPPPHAHSGLPGQSPQMQRT